MSDRPPIPKEAAATRAAFRAGVKGMRYTENSDPALDIPVVTDAPAGPNERHFEAVERLPGLSEPEAAYEAGRALRMIGHLLDGQGSPVEHGQAFLSQLADAVLFFGLRGERQPWGAEDTAFVFLDTFKAPPTAAAQARDAIVTYARKRPKLALTQQSCHQPPLDHEFLPGATLLPCPSARPTINLSVFSFAAQRFRTNGV